jgi:flavin-dependent dehydrogenase
MAAAACVDWDVIVIGAGPAGSLAARCVALAGLSTLVVDAKQFPREKICGGYLNRRALDALRQSQLDEAAVVSDEVRVDRLELVWQRRKTYFRLPPGKIVCRTTFDHVLFRAAEEAGAIILTGAQAAVEPSVDDDARLVSVVRDGECQSHRGRVVICADGLSRTSLRRLTAFAVSTSANSRVGVGAVISGDMDTCRDGQITMVLTRYGYVGISRINARQFNIAAAVDRAALQRVLPADVVASMLEEGGFRVPADFRSANWRGTPRLTSRPNHVASERVFLMGDAAGYIEPFTGEGMAAALESAVAIAPLVVESVKNWTPVIAQRWDALHKQIVRDRQSTCRQLAWILRRPWAARATLQLCRLMPGIADQMIAKTTSPRI